MAQKCFSAARWTILVTVLAAFAHHAGALSVGDKTACAIESASGRLRCWGRGQNTNSPDAGDYYSGAGADELGDLIVPTDLHTNAFDVVVMESHVCALKAAALDTAKGKLVCFKAGNATSITLAHRGPEAEQPDLAATDFVRLSGKGEQVCALDETGKLSCWSETDFTSSWTAQDWTNAASKKYKSVSVGYDHMCAILLCDDSWECFGPPSVITTTSETTKIPAKYVDGNNANAQILNGSALKSISCGRGYMCGITPDTDGLKCWGELNIAGRFTGDLDSPYDYFGPSITNFYHNNKPHGWSTDFEENGEPSRGFTSVSAGEATMCVIGTDQTASSITTTCMGLSLWVKDYDENDSELVEHWITTSGCENGNEQVQRCLANFDYGSDFKVDNANVDDPDKRLPHISVMAPKGHPNASSINSMTQLDARHAKAGSFNLNGFSTDNGEYTDVDALFSISRCFAIDPMTANGEHDYSIRCDAFHPYIRDQTKPVDEGWAFGLDSTTTNALCQYSSPYGATTCYGVPPKFLGLGTDWAGTPNNNMRFKIPSERYQDLVCPVDECTADSDDCDTNAVCTDTTESYSCTCNNGYYGDGRDSGTGCTACDADNAASVISCQECDGADIAGCTSGTCATGFETFVSRTGCSKIAGTCATGTFESASATGCTACDADNAASVTSCQECDGAGIAGCTSGTCATGFETFVSKVGCKTSASPETSPSPKSEKKKKLNAATSLSTQGPVGVFMALLVLALVM